MVTSPLAIKSILLIEKAVSSIFMAMIHIHELIQVEIKLYTSVIVNLTTASLNGVKCPRHPGASTIGSQLLDETAPMAANPGNPAMSSHTEDKKGTCHSDIIYSGNKGR